MIASAASIGFARILPNGKCSNCREQIKREDKNSVKWWYFPIEGLHQNRENNTMFLRCPNCKVYVILE